MERWLEIQAWGTKSVTSDRLTFINIWTDLYGEYLMVDLLVVVERREWNSFCYVMLHDTVARPVR